jgi:hypothetical protein
MSKGELKAIEKILPRLAPVTISAGSAGVHGCKIRLFTVYFPSISDIARGIPHTVLMT